MKPKASKLRVINIGALFALLVMLSGIAHAMQHDLAHVDDHDAGGHYEEYYEHNCLQADIGGDEVKSARLLPPALLTDAPHLPRATAPHQTFAQTEYARGPPLTL